MNRGFGVSFLLLGLTATFILSWFAGRTAARKQEPAPVFSQQATVFSMGLDFQPQPTAASLSEHYSTPALQEKLRELASESNQSSPAHIRKLYEFARMLPLKQFPEALDLLSDSKKFSSHDLREELLAWWIENDSRNAIAYFVALPFSEQREFRSYVFDAWARVDSQGLLAWSKSIPEEEQTHLMDGVRSAVAKSLAKQDPELALSTLNEIPEIDRKPVHSDLTIRIFREWAEQNLQEVTAKILTLPPGTERKSALWGLFSSWVHTAPESALSWVAHLQDIELALEATTELAINLGGSAPETGLRLLSEKDLLAEPGPSVTVLTRSWIQKDRDAALRWAQSLPVGTGRDEVLYAMLMELSHEDPLQAADFFVNDDSITGNERLDDVALSIMNELAASGKPDDVLAFMSRLPEDRQEAVVKLAETPLVHTFGIQQSLEIGLQLPPSNTRQIWLHSIFNEITADHSFPEIANLLARCSQSPEYSDFVRKIVQERLSSNPDEVTALAAKIPGGRENVRSALEKWLNSRSFVLARQWFSKTGFFTAEEKRQIFGNLNPNGSAP